MQVHVLFFGMLKDIVGRVEEPLDLAPGSRLIPIQPLGTDFQFRAQGSEFRVQSSKFKVRRYHHLALFSLAAQTLNPQPSPLNPPPPYFTRTANPYSLVLHLVSRRGINLGG